jgi:transposase-like protein
MCSAIGLLSRNSRARRLCHKRDYGRQFDREVIVPCVLWHLRYKLSSRDLVEMMGERGIVLAHTTMLRWVQRICRL